MYVIVSWGRGGSDQKDNFILPHTVIPHARQIKKSLRTTLGAILYNVHINTKPWSKDFNN